MYEANDMMWSERGFFFLLANLGFACAERMLQVTLALPLTLTLALAPTPSLLRALTLQRHLLVVNEVDVSRTGLMLLNNGIGAGLTVIAVSFTAPREWRVPYC